MTAPAPKPYVVTGNGGFYSIVHIDNRNGKVDHEEGRRALLLTFPDGNANPECFALFSTSGIHGTYLSLEEVAASIERYGDTASFPDGEEPDDWCPPRITVLVVEPRIVRLRCGEVVVFKEDLPWLRRLRLTSWAAVLQIGAGSLGGEVYPAGALVESPQTMIARRLAALGWSAADLAWVLRCHRTTVDRLLAGRATLTAILARKLERALDIPAELLLAGQNAADLYRTNDPAVGIRARREEVLARKKAAEPATTEDGDRR